MDDFTIKLLQQMESINKVAQVLFLDNQQRFDGQQQVLNLLGKEEGLTQGTLAELLDIRPSSLAELLKKLETTGAIKRMEDTYDKRIKHVYLTDKGRERIIESSDKKENLSEQFFMGLTEMEQLTLEIYLEKLITSWPEAWSKYQEKSVPPIERLEKRQQLRQIVDETNWQELNHLDEHQIQYHFKQRFPHFAINHPMWKRQFEEMVREKRKIQYTETERLKPFMPISLREQTKEEE